MNNKEYMEELKNRLQEFDYAKKNMKNLAVGM